MKKIVYNALLLLTAMSITACGYSLRELYEGGYKNSPNFVDNYYDQWDETLDYQNPDNKNKKIKSVEKITLDPKKDFVFTSFDDSNMRLVELNYDKYVYSDYDSISEDKEEKQTKQAYGRSVNLSGIDPSFKKGFLSRLFDGQLFCDGHFENARVQIEPNSGKKYHGFAHRFTKELSTCTYFALQFKASVEYRRVINEKTISISVSPHMSNITLIVSFYLKDGDGYRCLQISQYIDGIDTNIEKYVLFGFQIGENCSVKTLERCAGISVEYELKKDEHLDDLNRKEVDDGGNPIPFIGNKFVPLRHALWLYEILLPHSTWH